MRTAALLCCQQPTTGRHHACALSPIHQQTPCGSCRPALAMPRLFRRASAGSGPHPRPVVTAAAAPPGQSESGATAQAGHRLEGGQQVSAVSWEFKLEEQQALAGGTLDIVRLEGTRMLRVWQPPGYSREGAAKQPYPLLLLNDGQNLFDDSLSFSGQSWRAAGTAAELIASGRVPPFLVAGVDHAGPLRSFEYLPYPPGSGPANFRLDAAQWPGGGVAAYCDRVLTQVLPWLAQRYGAATDARRVAFGGSSFGGICTLWACMHHGDKFGAALVESPSLWIANERFLSHDIKQYTGPWPQRVFLGMGSKEYTAIRGGDAQWDKLLVKYIKELAELLHSRGLDSSRLLWTVGEGDTHNEAAWARRLAQALTFLLEPWAGE